MWIKHIQKITLTTIYTFIPMKKTNNLDLQRPHDLFKKYTKMLWMSHINQIAFKF